MHFLDLLPILLIGLAIFGPKTLQSIARNTGKGVGQAKVAKDKLMSELPVEEISKLSAHIPQVPLNSRQAVQMLLQTPASASTTESVSKEQEEKTQEA